VENAIADGVHFFHLDALCSGVQIEVDFSVALTVIANIVYRWFARSLRGFENAQAKQLYRRFINTWADIRVDPTSVEIILPRRSHNPLLLEAGYDTVRSASPSPGGTGESCASRFGDETLSELVARENRG
jgi:hypothetical protein